MVLPGIAAAVDALMRADGGRLLAHLVGAVRDFQLAEDSLQDALESALHHWSRNGLPRSPPAWVMQTARRKAIDRLRRSASFRAKSAEIAHLIDLDAHAADWTEPESIADERLKLIFTCCHPAIDRKTAVALTLRSVCGLKTEEVADAFLDAEPAMAQRLVRARHKIAKAGITYEVPGPEHWPARLESVLAVLYLMFNEGYASSDARYIRADLCDEAIRLSRLLIDLCPGEAEPEGLLALMLLHHARRAGRLGADGGFLPLDSQDRSLWDRAEIADGVRLLEHALRRGRPGPYQLQAAIVAIHAEAPRFEDTDWREIVLIYDVLIERDDNPVYRLNRAVALSFAETAAVALPLLDPLEESLGGYQPFHAAKADLLARAGRPEEARQAYTQAIALAAAPAERDFLRSKRDRI